mmetsp:Transcript_95043/g.284945  ORF Transcript_95043/g.284945 Transcript_95043/m.284945 type:complete len:219 (-) Transcript_95043:216-872(-)
MWEARSSKRPHGRCRRHKHPACIQRSNIAIRVSGTAMRHMVPGRSRSCVGVPDTCSRCSKDKRHHMALVRCSDRRENVLHSRVRVDSGELRRGGRWLQGSRELYGARARGRCVHKECRGGEALGVGCGRGAREAKGSHRLMRDSKRCLSWAFSAGVPLCVCVLPDACTRARILVLEAPFALSISRGRVRSVAQCRVPPTSGRFDSLRSGGDAWTGTGA